MSHIFTQLIDNVLDEHALSGHIWFASDRGTPPEFSYQVNFPRLEMVFSGEYANQIYLPQEGHYEANIQTGDMLYIPPNAWNKPHWDRSCSVLSLLFGKRQIGFSLVSKQQDQAGFFDVQKHSIQAGTGRALDHIVSSLDMLSRENVTAPMDKHLLLALLSYSRQLLIESTDTRPRSTDVYHGICIYIQENFQRDITRESIAERFNISASHLSRLFRQQGHMRLMDYISWVRLERAKFMLNKYRFHLEEIATRCGYHDVNYFCRVFKQKTGLTPSQYRELSQPGEQRIQPE